MEVNLESLLTTFLNKFQEIIENYAPLAKQVRDNNERLNAVEAKILELGTIVQELRSTLATKEDIKGFQSAVHKAAEATPPWLVKTLLTILGLTFAAIIAEGYWIVNLMIALSKR